MGNAAAIGSIPFQFLCEETGGREGRFHRPGSGREILPDRFPVLHLGILSFGRRDETVLSAQRRAEPAGDARPHEEHRHQPGGHHLVRRLVQEEFLEPFLEREGRLPVLDGRPAERREDRPVPDGPEDGGDHLLHRRPVHLWLEFQRRQGQGLLRGPHRPGGGRPCGRVPHPGPQDPGGQDRLHGPSGLPDDMDGDRLQPG